MTELKRAISISFRGFDCKAAELIGLIGVPPKFLGDAGEPNVHNPKTTWRKSVVVYEIQFDSSVLWDDAISAIIREIGGPEAIERVVRKFNVQSVHLDIVLPIRQSELQEDGYVESQTMATLSKVHASLGFSFT